MKSRVKDVFDLFSGRALGILPGNLAFSFFLAIIPILTLIFYVLTNLNMPMDIIQNFLNNTFPEGVVNLLQPVFTSQISLDSIITIVFGLMVTANGCNAIILASNTIFNIEDASFLKRYIKSFFLTILLILLFAFIMIVPLFGRSIITLIAKFLDSYVKYENTVNVLYVILQIPVSIIFIFTFIKLVYIISPDQKIPGKYANKGALFTTFTWLLATNIYSYYINNVARYNLVYGNLANIVILLLWFYVLAYVFVVGLYLNKNSADAGIEKTNTIKLNEIRKKVHEMQG
ncbi:MAG: YihY/virulence factor BrkB family protein [Bacilli bacterium]|nr:YihY/virulence factor BrkB family protein [Bacilli bacterium]